MNSRAVIVAGMHRSGTSAVSAALENSGIEFGGNLMKGRKGINPKGYWENEKIVDLHNKLLESQGKRWDDVAITRESTKGRVSERFFAEELKDVILSDFSQSATWGVKDPRICNFLHLWISVLHSLSIEPAFLLIMRSPAEVIASLQRRNGFSAAKSAYLWLRHNLSAEFGTRNYNRGFLDFEDLLRDPIETIEQIFEMLDIHDVTPNRDEILRFLEPNLRHKVSTLPVDLNTDSWTWTESKKLYDLMRAARGSSGLELSEQFDKIRVAVETFENGIPDIVIEHFRSVSLDASAELNAVREQYKRISSTLSWRLTAPFRKVFSQF